MKQILIATTNPAKFVEIKHFLKELPVKLLSLDDINVSGEPIEDGQTFAENAIKKAKFYFEKTEIPTLADDGGIEIDFFAGAPGVKSKRWIGGRVTSDEQLINYTLKKMKGLPLSLRGAQLHTVLALALPDSKLIIKDSLVRGIIAEKPSNKITKGYPYRALFFLPEIGKYYDQELLTEAEYNKYCHRGKALKKLIPYIKKYILC